MFKTYSWLHMNIWVLGNFAKAKSSKPLFSLLINLEVRKKVGKIILDEDLLACQEELCPLHSLTFRNRASYI
jgi:hypothetical protein